MPDLHGQAPSLTADVVGPGLTPALVLAAARRTAPGVEFFARFRNGAESGLTHLLAGRTGVTFGRMPNPPEGLAQQPARFEPVSVLLPERHPLTELEEVPLESLRGTGPCARAGDHVTPGWEHAALQLLERSGIDPLAAHPHVPGAVLRPIVDPIPLFPWAMSWRADSRHQGTAALHHAVNELTAAHDWLAIPDGAWLPEPEASRQL